MKIFKLTAFTFTETWFKQIEKFQHFKHLARKTHYLDLESITSTGGSVVECSPATRAARVRFPASAFFKSKY